jgi:hypothetical protein
MEKCDLLKIWGNMGRGEKKENDGRDEFNYHIL